MGLLDHPHIVRLEEVIHMHKKTCLVLEYVQGGELFDYIVLGKLRETEARRLFRQMASAIEYCHANRVIHRGTHSP